MTTHTRHTQQLREYKYIEPPTAYNTPPSWIDAKKGDTAHRDTETQQCTHNNASSYILRAERQSAPP